MRKPSWAADDLDALPLEFDRHISGRGKFCSGWALQMDILSHPSIGVIETLQFGHCMAVLPFIIDQSLDARLLVEKGLAIEAERGEDGSFSGNDIARYGFGGRTRNEDSVRFGCFKVKDHVSACLLAAIDGAC
ncbi:hypothetical protein ACSBR2_004946 [Camellia fascicularis]